METQTQSWNDILKEAVTKKGNISGHYQIFRSYSVGNMFAAIRQAGCRDIPISPINTFKGWQKLGRSVKKGQKAIELCMPITIKKEVEGNEEAFTAFCWKKNWFMLSQTEGDEYTPQIDPIIWNQAAALKKLDIEQIPFASLNGNVEGYAKGREFALNPLSQNQESVLFHEIGHILLGHTDKNECVDTEKLSRSEKEIEAESVSYLCCSILGFEKTLEQSRGYLQAYLAGNDLTEKQSRKVFSVVDKILKAGREEVC